jgi:hypothetical protein
MLRTVLPAAVIAILSTALLASYSPPRAHAAAVFVTSPADSGPGTFRDAIEQANGNSNINLIILANGNPITLESTVEYIGSQNLMIMGSGISNRIIQGNGFSPDEAAIQTDCSLFESTGGADLTILRVTFQDTVCSAIEVYGEDGDGEITVTLNSVVIRNLGGGGLNLYEGNGYSDAAWNLRMISSRVEETGFYGYDAVNVAEYYDGDVTVQLSGTSLVNNWFGGLHLDEADDGNLSLTTSASKFNGNGSGASEEAAGADEEVSTTAVPVDDGIYALECGTGNLNVTMSASQANSNHDDGFDLNECGDGDMTLIATWTTANENGQYGFEGLEQDSGNYVARLTAVWTLGNELGGVFLTEEMDGNLDVRAAASVSNSNTVAQGYALQELDDGDPIAVFTAVSANGNGDAGFHLAASGAGDFTAAVIASSAQFNDDFALFAHADGDAGTIQLTGSILIGVVSLNNVNEI